VVEGVGWTLLAEGVETLWDLQRQAVARAAMAVEEETAGLAQEREPAGAVRVTP
jgi:hypothetical protein